MKKACPNDKDATVKYEECKKIVNQIRFQKAIAVDESAKSVANQIDLNAMSKFSRRFDSFVHDLGHLAMEKEYDGPHLEADGRVTKEFMFALLPYFENQKKLHKKYAYQVRRPSVVLRSIRPTELDRFANTQFIENVANIDRCHCTTGKNAVLESNRKFDFGSVVETQIYHLWRHSRAILRFVEHIQIEWTTIGRKSLRKSEKRGTKDRSTTSFSCSMEILSIVVRSAWSASSPYSALNCFILTISSLLEVNFLHVAFVRRSICSFNKVIMNR